MPCNYHLLIWCNKLVSPLGRDLGYIYTTRWIGYPAGSNQSIRDWFIASSVDAIKSIPDRSAIDSGTPLWREVEVELTGEWQQSTLCRPHGQVNRPKIHRLLKSTSVDLAFVLMNTLNWVVMADFHAICVLLYKLVLNFIDLSSLIIFFSACC